jgi:hypothetical protein
MIGLHFTPDKLRIQGDNFTEVEPHTQYKTSLKSTFLQNPMATPTITTHTRAMPSESPETSTFKDRRQTPDSSPERLRTRELVREVCSKHKNANI